MLAQTTYITKIDFHGNADCSFSLGLDPLRRACGGSFQLLFAMDPPAQNGAIGQGLAQG